MNLKHFPLHHTILESDFFELKPASSCSCSLGGDGATGFSLVLILVLVVPVVGVLALFFIRKLAQKFKQNHEHLAISLEVVAEPMSPNNVHDHVEQERISIKNDEVIVKSETNSLVWNPPEMSIFEEDDVLFYKEFTNACAHILEWNAFNMFKCNVLGGGKFAKVYKGLLTLAPDKTQVCVAVKKFKFLESKKDNTDSFLREIRTFETIGTENEHIVEFMGACCRKGGLYLITEYCAGGSLRNHLVEKMRPRILRNEGTRDAGNGYLKTKPVKPSLNHHDLDQLLHWCEQIACGMEYLGKKGIIHVDLACRNVLLSGDGKVKICDFGLSRKCSNTENYAHTFMSGEFPLNSFAPEWNVELMTSDSIIPTIYADRWAYGCIMWEIFKLGSNLYPTVLDEDLFRKYMAVRKLLLKKYRHDQPELAPDYVYEKMKECWNEVPSNRPSFLKLRNFFATQRGILGD